MREILFRGKRKDNGEWIYGNLLIDDMFSDKQKWNYYIVFRNERLAKDKAMVIPETVGQYTGLTDKNGKRIFEGDILHTPNNSNCTLWYVDYKNTAFCCNQGNANYSCVLDEFMQYSYVRIIGNFHDNPELLEVQE